MIGPHELAAVIGKLDSLCLDGRMFNDDLRARVNSTIVLLDKGNLEFYTVKLTVENSKKTDVSIFSPLGSVLLACQPGQALNIPGYGSGYRLLVSSVSHAD
jgi:transcription elongation GreA/GreB family factor